MKDGKLEVDCWVLQNGGLEAVPGWFDVIGQPNLIFPLTVAYAGESAHGGSYKHGRHPMTYGLFAEKMHTLVALLTRMTVRGHGGW